LFPGAETIVVLIAIVVAELLQRGLDLKTLHDAMNSSDAAGSYTQLQTSESGPPAGAPPPQVGSRRRRLSMIMTDDSAKKAARERAMHSAVAVTVGAVRRHPQLRSLQSHLQHLRHR